MPVNAGITVFVLSWSAAILLLLRRTLVRSVMLFSEGLTAKG
ncbi:MAG TPA: hypothetical protein VGB71_19655 [Flavisolibacter sp.]